MPRDTKRRRKKPVRRNYKQQVLDARIIMLAIQLALPSYIVSNQKRLKEAMDKFLTETEDITN